MLERHTLLDDGVYEICVSDYVNWNADCFSTKNGNENVVHHML